MVSIDSTNQTRSSRMVERHISRWRLPAERAALADASATAATVSTSGGDAGAVSLRYLDEFVRKLQCAPSLLAHQLFPDAKEITESMGLFNAVRRYVIKGDSETCNTSELTDGIVVVGDGNTPRSAALFAYRLKQWKCYSVDPAMELPSSSARAERWQTVQNLVVIRNKIENVHVKLRRAVVVLVHAHVTLEQALSAVECEDLVGVVTIPCCNWYGKQEELNGKPPTIVYDDFSILSDHRELRVWVDPRGKDLSDVASLDQSSEIGKGCVRKEFVADYVVPFVDQEKSLRKMAKRNQGSAMILLKEAVSDNHPNNTACSAFISARQQAMALDLVESEIVNRHARLLLLTSNCNLAKTLLHRGFENVFMLQSPSVGNADGDGGDPLTCEVVKISASTCSLVANLRCTSSGEAQITIDSGTQETIKLFDCVIDCGVLFRSLRSQPKKSCGVVFEHIVHLLLSFTDFKAASTRLITISPRKDWRKAEYLANPRLEIFFSTSIVGADSLDSSTLFVYRCKTSAQSLTLTGSDKGAAQDQAKKKQQALQLKAALAHDFTTYNGIAVSMSIPDAIFLVTDSEEAEPKSVKVRGIVQHLRRYTTGPSFFSIAPPDATSSFRDHIQISIDSERLTHWNKTLSLDAVFRLIHKGDFVECVGELAVNAQKKPMLKLDALHFLQSEFQAYQ